MGEKPDIRIELSSDPAYLAGVRQLIAQVGERIGFDEAACSKIALAVDEALANVIRHGYGRACGRPIWVSAPPCGSRRVRCRRTGWRPPRARRASVTAVRW